LNSKPSAELILQYLEQNQHASALELSRALKLTVQDIRYNLRQLQSQEKITAYSQRPAQGRGRPTTLFVLNTSAIQGLETLILTLFDLFASEHHKRTLYRVSLPHFPVSRPPRNQ
jgi:predicted ArsR family transcriptional regulator